MSAKDLIKAGKLFEARKQLTEEVKLAPSDLNKRTLLFQALAFCGEWDKAERHLDAIVAQDSARETGVQVYRNLIRAERQRLEVTRLNARPSFLPTAPPYVESYFEAWKKVVARNVDEAMEIYEEIYASLPEIAGTVSGKRFDDFRDTDAFLCFFLEAMVYEKYVWFPFEAIRELSILPPATLLDMLWVRALVTTWDGLTVNCYLPVLYPESWRHDNELVKLGRMTDWVELGGSLSKGMGRHVYQAGDEEIALLDFTEIQFTKPEDGVGNNERSH